MRWPFPRRMVERSCLECWDRWTVPSGLAHDRQSGLGQRGFSGQSIIAAERDASWAMFGSAMQMQMAEARRRDAKADRNVALRRQLGNCPKCTSERFTERRVWQWAPAPPVNYDIGTGWRMP